MHAERTEITAAARAALQYLAERSKQAIEAAKIAEWIGHSQPKTQAALAELRERGLVRHFPGQSGHAGSWAVSAAGYQEIDVAVVSPDRYRMALEAILELPPSYSSEAKTMQAIARRALKP